MRRATCDQQIQMQPTNTGVYKMGRTNVPSPCLLTAGLTAGSLLTPLSSTSRSWALWGGLPVCDEDMQQQANPTSDLPYICSTLQPSSYLCLLITCHFHFVYPKATDNAATQHCKQTYTSLQHPAHKRSKNINSHVRVRAWHPRHTSVL